jgi:hypothetical protein
MRLVERRIGRAFGAALGCLAVLGLGWAATDSPPAGASSVLAR